MTNLPALHLVSFLSLALTACSASESSESFDERDGDDSADADPTSSGLLYADEIEDVLLNGGALAYRVPEFSHSILPPCSEELCAEGDSIGGCCASASGVLCYSCELPVEVMPIHLSECHQDLDCGDVMVGNRCAVDSGGRGSCYQLCGGALGFTCEADEICMTPIVNFGQDGSGVCISPLLTEEEDEINWTSTVAHALSPNRVDHLKDGIVKHADAE